MNEKIGDEVSNYDKLKESMHNNNYQIGFKRYNKVNGFAALLLLEMSLERRYQSILLGATIKYGAA